MRAFAYTRATDVGSALTALAGAPQSKFLGGGTNLVDLMRLGVETPATLVDITRLPFGDVREAAGGGGLVIGATVRNSDLAADPLVRSRYPALAQALLAGASGQLRNRATVGGNLLQRTRCLYFQDVTKPCNKREPGSGCPAREGEHKNLAIIGQSEQCVATHPSDMAVPLAAFDAVVHVVGPAGERTIPLTELHRLPADEPERDTVLGADELIIAVELPPLDAAAHSTYRKVRERASFSFALVSLAAGLDAPDGTVRDVRLALGGIAHKPWRASWAEAALRGAPATEASFVNAAEAELAHATPLRDNGFKVQIAHNLIVQTLLELAGAR